MLGENVLGAALDAPDVCASQTRTTATPTVSLMSSATVTSYLRTWQCPTSPRTREVVWDSLPRSLSRCPSRRYSPFFALA